MIQEGDRVVFDTARSMSTRHRRNVLKSGELQEESVCAKFAHCKLSPLALQTGWYLENFGELARDSVVAFFATAATTEEPSVVQKKGLRKIRPRIRLFNKVTTLLIAESPPEEKDVLTRAVVNLINRRNM